MSGNLDTGWRAPVFGLLVGVFIATLSLTSINVAIPTLMLEFRANTGQVQWVVNVYTLTIGVIIPVTSWLMQRLGDKQTYVGALLVFTAASVLCALSPSLSFLIVARAVQAVGGGILVPVTTSIMYRMVPAERIGSAMGLWGAATMAAPAIGPALGGFLVSLFGWSAVFWLNVPIGLAGAVVALRLVPNSRSQARKRIRFDLPGFLILAAALFTLQMGVGRAGSHGWTSGPAITLLTLSAVALLGFAMYELRLEAPLLDLRLFGNRRFAVGAACAVVMTVGLYGGSFYVPIMLQSAMGLGPARVGLVLMPGAVVSALLQPLSGRLYDRYGPRVLVVSGMVALVMANWSFSRITVHSSPTTVVWLQVLRGIGIALGYTPAMTAGLSAVRRAAVAGASSMTQIMQRVGGSLTLALLTGLLTERESLYRATAASPEAALVRGISDVFLVSMVVTVVGVIAAFALGGQKTTAATQPAGNALENN